MAELENAGLITLFDSFPKIFSQTPESLIWECPIHGVIEPRVWGTGFVRRGCPCVRMKREYEQEQLLRQQVQQQIQQQRASKTYTWLGPQFSEEGLEELTFTNFFYQLQPDKLLNFRMVWEQAKDFATQIQADPNYCRNLLFYGTWGTGKTHLAAAILNELREASIPCLFTTAQGILDAMYDQFSKKESTASIIEQAVDTRVLVIDDLDKLYIPPTSEGKFQKSMYFKILDKRYKRRLPTIITMNETDPTPYVGEAVASRLQVGLLTFQMDGKDLRQTRII